MSQLHSEILSRAVACRLLSDQQIEQCRAGLPADASGDVLLSSLLKSGLLTRWQVKQLQAGKTVVFLVAQYKLLEPIGAGGMGQVFRAADTNVARRQVAIKILPRHIATPAAIARFRREGATALQLQHDHIVRCFELGQQGETHFLVMELVEGATLKDYITKQGRLSVQETARIGHEVALALEHAWQQQIVHRDIKPSNILLTRDNRVKLADMGLAKFFGPQGDEHALATRTGMLLGTLDYLAPEQAEDAKRADIRSDIYALGCTLYHCLTGAPPFATGTEVQKIMAHREQPAPPIAQRNKEVENLFADIVEKRMLAKRPDDRYQTPAEVAADLEPWMGGASRAFNVLDLLEQVVEQDAASGTPLAKPPVVQTDWESYHEHERKGEAAPGTRPVQRLRAGVHRVGRTVGLSSLRDVLIAAGAMLAVALVLFGIWRADRGDTSPLEQPGSPSDLAGAKPQQDDASGGGATPVNSDVVMGDWIDLLAPIDFAKVSNSTRNWSRDAGRVIGTATGKPELDQIWAVLTPPQAITGDYDLEVDFQFAEPRTVQFLLPLNETNVAFTVIADRGTELHWIDRKKLELENPPVRPQGNPAARPQPGIVHHLSVSVRHQGENVTVETTLDGQPAGRFSGLRSRLSVHASNRPLRNRLVMTTSFSKEAADLRFELHQARLRFVKPAAPSDDGWIDLLPPFEPLVASNTTWQRDGARLICTLNEPLQYGWGGATAAQEITGDYDLEMDFLFVDCLPVQIALPLNETNVTLSVVHNLGTGLHWIDGKDIFAQPIVRPTGNPGLKPQPGVLHHFTASVRHQGENVTVETTLDGTPAGSFSGLRSRLTIPEVTKPVRHRLRVGPCFQKKTGDRRFELHKVRLRPVKSSAATVPDSAKPATQHQK